jgi:hypothetical protein
MIKFLLILGIIAYLLFKIGGFFFKAGAASQQFRQPSRRPDNAAHNQPPKSKVDGDGHIKGGEYVDYEEVK